MILLIVDPPNQDLVSDTIAAEAYKRANPLIPIHGRIQQGRRSGYTEEASCNEMNTSLDRLKAMPSCRACDQPLLEPGTGYCSRRCRMTIAVEGKPANPGDGPIQMVKPRV